MTTKNEIMIVDEESIKHKVYTIRGIQVMLDFELAEIYGYSTKAFNQQIKRNIDKFEGYIFQLSKEELTYLTRSQFVTPIMQEAGTKGGRTYLPYAFTESGVYMLMTVLRGPLATEQSRRLINVFKNMKDYITSSNHLLSMSEVIGLVNQVNENKQDIKEVKNQLTVVMDNFIDESKYKEFVILNGHKFTAVVAYQTIYKRAKKCLRIVDDYIDIKTIQSLFYLSTNVEVTIYSDNVNKMDMIVVDDFMKETGINIKIYKTKRLYHDRYILIDDKILYMSGPSIKDAGNAIGMILEVTNIELVKFMKELINHLSI